jgi:hypothetical protein
VTELIGKTSSTLGASSFKNFSTVSCSHSFSETVFLVSLSLLGLIGSLHDLHLLVYFLTSLSYIKERPYESRIYYKTKLFICQVFFYFFVKLTKIKLKMRILSIIRYKYYLARAKILTLPFICGKIGK